jgi:hypothetical protein
VSVDLNVVKNLELNTDNKILSTHNLIPPNKELEELFNKYKFHQNLQNSRVLYLKSCRDAKNLSSRIVTSRLYN